jgi:hypothetical protein
MLGARASLPAALALALAACRSTDGAASSEGKSSDGIPIHGSLVSRYQGRWTSGAHDNDLTEVLTLEVGDKKKDPVTGYLLAEGLADLDGHGSSTFHSLADTYDSAVTARLYDAHADLHVSKSLDTLRVGRQSIVETPEVAYFDGARAETVDLGEARIRLGAFGGVPVKLYTSSTAGDSMFGTFAQARPWTGGRLRADWMHVEDEGSFGPRQDDLLGLGASQNFGSNLRIEAQHTRLENEARDLRLRGSYAAKDSDLVLQASWYRLMQTQKDFTVPFDPFYSTLFDLFPYSQVGFLASKSLGKHLDLQGGADVRRISNDDDIGEFNRDFNRYFLTSGIRGVLPAALDLSLTGEIWDSQESDFSTYGADLARHFGATVDASVGTYYSLYKYDLFQNRELDDVRTWYLKVAWNRATSTTFDFRYEYEDDSSDEYHSLRLGMIWRF